MAKTAPDRSIRSAEPLPPIRIGALQQKSGLVSYGVLLVTFMRIVSVLWMAEGLSDWAAVLLDEGGVTFADASLQQVAAIVFFCILDFIAAVGLWLGTPWGGVVWLVTVGGQLLSLILLPGFSRYPWLHSSLDVSLVAGYLMLAWLAAREEEGDNR